MTEDKEVPNRNDEEQLVSGINDKLRGESIKKDYIHRRFNNFHIFGKFVVGSKQIMCGIYTI